MPTSEDPVIRSLRYFCRVCGSLFLAEITDPPPTVCPPCSEGSWPPTKTKPRRPRRRPPPAADPPSPNLEGVPDGASRST